MRREPCLDIAATLRRQFVVDVGVQLVFGDGNLWVGHGRCLCLVLIENCLSAGCNISPHKGWGLENHCDSMPFITSTCIIAAIISPVAAPDVRPRERL